MKQLKYKYLLLLMAVLCSIAARGTTEVTIDGIKYNLDEGNLTASVGNNSNSYSFIGELIIPSSVSYNNQNYEVTTIGENAFSNCGNITSVSIPSTVKTIDGLAFSDCNGLTSITIPNNVTTIGHMAFYHCANVQSLSLGSGVIEIGNCAFDGCSNLTSLIIPNNVTSIGTKAFNGCYNLVSLTIGTGVENWGDEVFWDCQKLESLVFTEGRTYIGGNRIFNGGSFQMSITIPTSVTTIGDYAFDGLSNISSITIPNSVTAIGKRAFSNCYTMSSITLPENLVSIGEEAFSGCSGMYESSLSIPKSVTAIDRSAFISCSFKSIIVEEGNEYYDSRNSCNAIIETNTNTLIRGSLTTTIPNTVTTIGEYAFSSCRIQSLTIPESVTTINKEAFRECIELAEITLPASVNTIGENAFYSCNQLQTIVYHATSLPALGEQPFPDGIYQTCVVKVHEGMVNSFRQADVWSNFTNIIAIVDDGLNEGDTFTANTTEGVEMVFKVISKNDMTCQVGNGSTAAISASTNGTITIPRMVNGYNVSGIGDKAFYNCSTLTNVSIPEIVTSIGTSAFENCSGLTSLIIPDRVTSIKSRTFYGCSGLTDFAVPYAVTSIGNNAFYGCSGLKEFPIRYEGITTIEGGAFGGCTNLSKIIIPRTVTKFGSNVFSNCTNLTDIYFPATAVPTGGKGLVSNYNDVILHVTTSLVNNFKTASYWNSFTNIVPIMDGSTFTATTAEGVEMQFLVMSDYENSCQVGNGNTAAIATTTTGTVTIPQTANGYNVKYVGQHGFYECSGLTGVVIPGSVVDIQSNVFEGCTNLTDISYPTSTVPFMGPEFMDFQYYEQVTLRVLSSMIDEFKSRDPWMRFQNIVALTENPYGDQSGDPSSDPSSDPSGNVINYLEYAIDGLFSNAKRVQLAPNADGETVFDLDYSDMEYGLNHVAFRIAAISNGVTHYSSAMFKDIYRYPTQRGGVEEVEYMVDGGPKYHQQVIPDANGNVSFDIDASVLHYGLNNLGIRLVAWPSGEMSSNIDPPGEWGDNDLDDPIMDEAPALNLQSRRVTPIINPLGTYSCMVFRQVFKYHAQDAHTTGVEYSINGGKPVFVAANGDDITFDIDVEAMQVGINILTLRAVSENSETGRTPGAPIYRYVYRPASNGIRDIEFVEYYWDNDPSAAKKLELNIDGELALVDCDINTRGIYGEHVLNLRAYSHGVWSPIYQKTVNIPVIPLSGNLVLDPTKTEDEDNNTFQTLSSLIRIMSMRGLAIGLNVNVADAEYTFTVSEESLGHVQTLATLLTTANLYFNMKAPNAATFNFVLPLEFITAHQSELATIVGYVQTLFSHILTENISIIINGEVYNYDGFQVDPNDLLALKQFYNRTNGPLWTTKKWSFSSNGRDMDELPGVICNVEGHVTALDLENNGLCGELNDDWCLDLPYCRTLKLAKNNIHGDIAPFLNGLSLDYVDMSYNCLSLASATVNISEHADFRYQYVNYRDNDGQRDSLLNVAKLDKPYLLYISNSQNLVIPSLFIYDLNNYNFNLRPTINILDGSAPQNSIATYNNNSGFSWLLNSEYTNEQDAIYTTRLSLSGSIFDGSIYPAKVRYVKGDANMSGAADVIDIQHTLNRILFTATPFNYSAANTYVDNIINVQDIVCTVNILMGNEDLNAMARSLVLNEESMRRAATQPQASLFVKDGRVNISSLVPVGALDIELKGVTTQQVSLLLNHRQFQMVGRNTERGSRYVIYSPVGQPIPSNELCSLLKVSGDAQIQAVQVSDMDAVELAVTLNDETTGIQMVKGERGIDNESRTYNLNGQRVEHPKKGGIYIVNGKKIIIK